MVAYSLHFGEETKFGFKRVRRFMDNLRELVRGINKGEFTREEYIEQLKEAGIEFHQRGE